ncbi:hypothetical protein M427DRAFT_326123 [Gonapodya prolifera JEL478]|uniref:Uncharacterized protein n=1 Tax=Gonapodya prolifera (strain JEL478) TaxID=1344416 RepID=A0A139AEH9_GONPJ|nr:hypothetical protein M427DRAFT_326123 [Gonapodya prolifera JEL478]|eukprot:KXS15201.1 hypothetical protein M427DRAFT_326123 [Gonapodya prolifera JEL478]
MSLPSLESLGLLHLGTREPSSHLQPSRSPPLPASSAPGVAFSSSESFASKPVDPGRDPRDTSALNAFANPLAFDTQSSHSPRVDSLPALPSFNPHGDWAERHPYLQGAVLSEAAQLYKPQQFSLSPPSLSASSSSSSLSLSHPTLPPSSSSSWSAWNVTEQGRWAEPLPLNPMDALSAVARDAGRRFAIETQYSSASYSAR